VRALARDVETLAAPADTSTLVGLHAERGMQLAMGDALTTLRAPGRLDGMAGAIDERLRTTPMVDSIIDAATPVETALTPATRDALLETALRRLDTIGSSRGVPVAGDALDAYRDLAALATQSRELTDTLAPVLAAAERSTIDDAARRAPITSSDNFNSGRNMWGIAPFPRVVGLGAETAAPVASVRAAITKLQAGMPEIEQAIRADAPAPVQLDFETLFTTRLDAARSASALEA
jgi:hypothetical protein